MKILYTYNAINDLDRLRSFIAKDSQKAAYAIQERISQAIERLESFPSLGKKVKNKKSTVSLRDLITGSYIIRYALLGSEIHILRIWHGKEDMCFIL